MSNKKK